MGKLPEAEGGEAVWHKTCPQLGEDNVNSGFVDSAAKQASAHVE